MVNADTNVKYRIRSLNLKTNLFFVVEEIGIPGEFRISARKLLTNPDMLYAFADSDIKRIVYTAEIEKDKLLRKTQRVRVSASS